MDPIIFVGILLIVMPASAFADQFKKVSDAWLIYDQNY
jgi:hypothetical protein